MGVSSSATFIWIDAYLQMFDSVTYRSSCRPSLGSKGSGNPIIKTKLRVNIKNFLKLL